MQQGPIGQDTGFRSLKEGSTDPQAVARYYDDWAENYDETLRDWNYQAPDDASELLCSAIAPGSRVLDVGCGTGLFAEALMRRGAYRLEGLDISEASLEQARARGVYDRAIRHDLSDLPLPVATDGVDAAASVGVLTYIEDAEALMVDLCRCVRPGGAIAFTQRSDLWEARGFPDLIARLEARKLWETLHVSPPRQYLPGNDDFADEVKVIHVLCRVVGQ